MFSSNSRLTTISSRIGMSLLLEIILAKLAKLDGKTIMICSTMMHSLGSSPK
jgi:myo-inositol catabolism protein IolC